MSDTKSFVRLVVFFVCFLLLAAVPTWAATSTSITLWGPSGLDNRLAVEQLVADFNAENPDLYVDVQPLGSIGVREYDQFLAAVAGGVGPDVIWMNRITVPNLAALGAFRPLDDLMEESVVLNRSRFIPQILHEGTYQGKVYGLPIFADTFGLVWNKQHFEQAGLSNDNPPTTWTELRDYARKLTQVDGSGKITQLGIDTNSFIGRAWLYSIAAQQGDEFVSEDGTRVRLDTPGMVRGLEWTLETLDLLGGWGVLNSARSPMRNGRTSMDPSSNTTILDQLESAGFPFEPGVAPTPISEGGQQVAYIGGWAYSVTSQVPDERMPAVRRLLEYLLDTEQQVKRFQMSPRGWPASYDALAEVAELLESLPRGEYSKVYLDLTRIAVSRGNSPIAIDILNALETAARAAVNLQATPVDALREQSNQLQASLNEFVNR